MMAIPSPTTPARPSQLHELSRLVAEGDGGAYLLQRYRIGPKSYWRLLDARTRAVEADTLTPREMRAYLIGRIAGAQRARHA